jgi:hypothetical protein
MLAPNVNPVMDNLARSYSTITRVDAFAYAAMNSAIGKLSPDPDWLGPIRQELTLLNAAGAQWQAQKPTVWAPILTQFVDYSSLFAGFAEVSKELGNDRDAWIKLLTELSQSLALSANVSSAAERAFTLQANNLNNVETVFNASIKKAWAALASEEEQMLAMAEQIGALQERVATLEADLSAGAISAGQGLIQSTVTISYAVLVAASVSVPYLTLAGMLFTLGKGAYDLIVTDQKIHDAIDKITELRVAMSEEAQAAAMSKAIVQLITAFDLSLATAGRQLPALSEMWTAEKQKVQGAIHALEAGAVPKDMIELIAMPSAAATWNALAGFVTKLLATPAMGRPVTLSTTGKF